VYNLNRLAFQFERLFALAEVASLEFFERMIATNIRTAIGRRVRQEVQRMGIRITEG
jgi:hypothetical protein